MKIKQTLFKEKKKTGKRLEEVKQCNPILGTIHNLWVVGTMGIWRGAINFHPKYLWGASNFNWYSVHWGHLKLTLIMGLV